MRWKLFILLERWFSGKNYLACMQARGAKFYLPEPTFEKEKAKGGSTLIIIVLGRQRQTDPCGSLVSQHNPFSMFQASKRPCVKKLNGEPERRLSGSYCFPRRSAFNYQHSHGNWQLPRQFQGIKHSLLASTNTRHALGSYKFIQAEHSYT